MEEPSRRSRTVLCIGDDHVTFVLYLEAGSLDGFARRRGVRREDVKRSFILGVAVDVDLCLRDGVERFRDHARPILAEVDADVLACGLHAWRYLLPAGTRASPPGRRCYSRLLRAPILAGRALRYATRRGPYLLGQ